METKKWYQSLTIWFSGLIFFLPEISEFLEGAVKENVIDDPKIIFWVIKIVALINLYIRIFRTKKAIQ